MLKQQARLLAIGVFSLDLVLVVVAFLLSFAFRSFALPSLLPGMFPQQLYPLAKYLPLLPLALVCWAIPLIVTGQYKSHRTTELTTEALAIFRVCGAGTVLFALAIFALRLDRALLGNDQVSRSWLLLLGAMAAVLLLCEKIAIRGLSRYVRERGYNYRTLLIVGTGETAEKIARSIDEHPYWGFRILGFVETGDEQVPAHLEGKIVGSIADLPDVITQQVVDDVFFAVRRQQLGRLEPILSLLQEQGIRTRIALNLVPDHGSRLAMEELDGLPLLSVSQGPTNLPQLFFKRVFDVSLAAFLLALTLPVVGVVALLIRITSKGSVLYSQTRCGLNGRRFTLYKFRTMVEGADQRRSELNHLNEMDGPVFKIRRDPRVTPFGRFLRRFSLDEIPQLWNVLRGDMSLVGPRPPVPEEVESYARWQRRRLSMKPGLTCLWQISGRNHLDFNRWMELDLEYIDSWSPGLDFKILLKTIPVVLTGRGAY